MVNKRSTVQEPRTCTPLHLSIHFILPIRVRSPPGCSCSHARGTHPVWGAGTGLNSSTSPWRRHTGPGFDSRYTRGGGTPTGSEGGRVLHGILLGRVLDMSFVWLLNS